MDRQFACTDCGHETAYRPEGCGVVVRFKPGGGLVGARYRLVRCAGCGKEHDVPEEKARKAGPWWRPAGR